MKMKRKTNQIQDTKVTKKQAKHIEEILEKLILKFGNGNENG